MLARIIAGYTNSRFVDFSAVTAGIKEIRNVMEEAEEGRSEGKKTILFIDEIHRFSKAQQDAILTYVEQSSITLIGATTESPSFELNVALLSRARVFVLKSLSEEDFKHLLKRAVKRDVELGKRDLEIEDDILELIASL